VPANHIADVLACLLLVVIVALVVLKCRERRKRKSAEHIVHHNVRTNSVAFTGMEYFNET